MRDAGRRWVALVGALLVATPVLAQTSDLRRSQRTRPHAGRTDAAARAVQDAEDPEVAAAVEHLREARAAGGDDTSAAGRAREELLFRTSSGHVRALVSAPDRPYRVMRPGADRTARGLAQSFLNENAVAFGTARPGAELRASSTRRRGSRDVVRFEQRVSGRRVFGAGVVIQVESSGGVSFALSDVAPEDSDVYDPALSGPPAVDAQRAVEAARDTLLAEVRGPDVAPRGDVELMLFDPDVLGASGPAALVWYVRLVHPGRAVDEVVLVNALSGEVAFHYSNVHELKNRIVYDHGNDPFAVPATPARSEGDGPVGSPVDVDLAYDHLGDTYDFYQSRFGRDSYDGAGASLVGRVRHCDPYDSCPYDNAYWSGSEVIFGDGYAAADDVVAHELTHAVNENESGLIYWGESGAIDESLADIFGELVDLTNGTGNDAAGVRWLIGEDLSIGAFRNMADPPAFGDPDRRYSPNWFWELDDNRGVHVNSGVGNKLASLLVDGGAFNGQTVAALGIDAVADLFYEAQANLLTPASDYFDLFFALRQAALNLGWPIADRQALDAAALAVEIAVPSDQQVVFNETFEGKLGKRWDISDQNSDSGTATWGKSSFRRFSGKSSLYCAAAGSNPARVGGPYRPNMEAWMVRGPLSLADVDDAWLDFDLYLDVEPPPPGDCYDDIWWGVSTDDNEYYGYALCPAPDGLSDGWVHIRTSLKELEYFGPVVGSSTVYIAFVFDSDEIVQYEGAYIDNVRLTRASTPSLDLTAPAGGQSWPVDSLQLVTWSSQGLRATDQVRLSLVDGASVTEIATLPSDQTSYWWTVAGSVTSTARVRVECVGCFPETFDESDAEFSIVPPPSPALPKADFDNDGKPDILWRKRRGGALSTWLMDGLTQKSVLSLVPNKEDVAAWKVVGLGDFDQDSKGDLLWRHSKTGKLAVWLMDGENRVGVRQPLVPETAASKSWQVAAVADFDQDGKPDILFRNVDTGFLEIWLMDGLVRSGDPVTPTPAKEKLVWEAVGAGDFNRDGRPDLLFRNQNNGVLVVWLLDEAYARMGGRIRLTPKNNPEHLFVGIEDLDLDGMPDLLFRNQNNGNLAVWYMNGFTRVAPQVGTSPAGIKSLGVEAVLR